jgi:hypothetical protein
VCDPCRATSSLNFPETAPDFRNITVRSNHTKGLCPLEWLRHSQRHSQQLRLCCRSLSCTADLVLSHPKHVQPFFPLLSLSLNRTDHDGYQQPLK